MFKPENSFTHTPCQVHTYPKFDTQGLFMLYVFSLGTAICRAKVNGQLRSRFFPSVSCRYYIRKSVVEWKSIAKTAKGSPNNILGPFYAVSLRSQALKTFITSLLQDIWVWTEIEIEGFLKIKSYPKIFGSEHFKVIHCSTLMSSQSSTWKMTTSLKLDITQKLIARFQFCKKYLIMHNLRNQTVCKN